MKLARNRSKRNAVRFVTVFLAALSCIGAALLIGGNNASANHPVLVEGNCDSPVPGTTIVNINACGDYDGDGRIGTAEDTDGADRIFGTLEAAIGPGEGAAAGTGANHNGKIIIVRSGRFAEALYIGQNLQGPGAPGIADPGNVTIEAAPGVEANIDAVFQGDPGGGNTTRQGGTGIQIVYNNLNRVVTLRNLQIRNWSNGITVSGGQVHIDRCRLENNLNYGIRVTGSSRVTITNTQVESTGFRIGTGGSSTAAPGHGIQFEDSSQGRIAFSDVSHSAGAGIVNFTGVIPNVVIFKVTTYFNNQGGLGGNGVTIAPDHNHAQ